MHSTNFPCGHYSDFSEDGESIRTEVLSAVADRHEALYNLIIARMSVLDEIRDELRQENEYLDELNSSLSSLNRFFDENDENPFWHYSGSNSKLASPDRGWWY